MDKQFVLMGETGWGAIKYWDRGQWVWRETDAERLTLDEAHELSDRFGTDRTRIEKAVEFQSSLLSNLRGRMP